jgi:alpha-tubulin suppressor-like RCC1 family protein
MGTTDGQSTEVSCCQTRPVAVVGDVIFTWISTGGIHACALTAEGVPYCWGSDQEGRFGLDTAASKDYPAPIRVHTDVRMREISVWAWHTCALSQHGVAYCWGRGVERQLGVDRPSEAQPAPMAIATSLKFAHIRVGASHSCALTEDGTLYCWGSNKFGQATGRSMDVARPEQLFADNRFAMVSLGGNDFSGHTCGLTSDGVLQCWGSDSHRQLGVYGRSER